MSTTAILFLLLAGGESGYVSVPVEVCRQASATLARGEAMSVDLEDGRQRQPVVAAACFSLPLPAGACEEEES